MRKYLLMAACSVAALNGTANAQETSGPAGEEVTSDEIIVTANRRAQSMQDVPVSISVINNESLAAAGVVNSTQIQLTTPGVNIATGVGAPIVFIRGMGTANLVAEGAVGLYLDGVYLPYSGAIDNSFLDIERVEVLKGPQGTLYGRNTTAGAINFVSRDPSAKETVEVTAKAGNWGTRQVQGYASSGPGPFAASVAAQYTSHDPYLHNLVPGRHDLNDRDEFGIRARFKAELGDNWTATLAADYVEADDFGSIGFVSLSTKPQAADPMTPGQFSNLYDSPRTTYADFPAKGHKIQNYGGSFTVRGDLGFAELVSITGYRFVEQSTSEDNDASSAPLLSYTSSNIFKNWSQELQLVSSPSSKIEWIAGLYAFNLVASIGPTGAFFAGNTGGPDVNQADLIVYGKVGTRSYAAYGQVTVPLFDALKVTAGLRYSNEQPKLTRQDVTVPGFGVVLADTPEKTRFTSLDPKVGLQYDFGGGMLYATFTKGFRSGSYNLGSPGSPGPVRPEKVDAYEIGGKHKLASGVYFNWAGWYYKYDGLQVSRVLQNSGGGLFTNQNAASAVSKGVEASIAVSAVRHLRLDLSASYIDAKYKNFDGAAAFIPSVTGFGLQQAQVDVSDRPLPRAPEFTLSAQATYNIPIGDGSIDLSGNVYYTSSYLVDTPSNVKQKGYELINLSAMYNLPGGHWSVGAFATNVTKSVYVNYLSANVTGFSAVPSDPRIIGGMLSFKY